MVVEEAMEGATSSVGTEREDDTVSIPTGVVGCDVLSGKASGNTTNGVLAPRITSFSILNSFRSGQRCGYLGQNVMW